MKMLLPAEGEYLLLGLTASLCLLAIAIFSFPKAARWKVTWCMFRLLFPQEAKGITKDDHHKALKNKLLAMQKAGTLTPAETDRVLEAALALKMALRTFDLVPVKKKQS